MNGSVRNLRIEDVAKVIPGAAKGLYNQEPVEALNKAFLLKGVNLDQDGGVQPEGMEEVYLSPGKNTDRYLLKANDIVVMARGSAMRVSLVDEAVEQKNVIASANFLIIRPRSELVKSEVIVAYLNSEVGRSRLLAQSTGAGIQHIPTASLRDLKIPVPSCKEQERIALIFHASIDAYRTTLELADQQKATASAAMLTLMMGESL